MHRRAVFLRLINDSFPDVLHILELLQLLASDHVNGALVGSTLYREGVVGVVVEAVFQASDAALGKCGERKGLDWGLLFDEVIVH